MKARKLKSFLNGVIFKYWTKLKLKDILTYNKEEEEDEEEKSNKQKQYRKNKELLELNNSGVNVIEKEFIMKNSNEKIQCKDYTVTI